MVDLASIFAVFLIAQVRVTVSDVNIALANEDSQFVGQYPKTAINITLNVSSPTNISGSLEQCADAGRPLLFVKNTTILGCGTLLWPEDSNVPSNHTVNPTSVTLPLNINLNSTIISSQNGTISITDTIQPSSVKVYWTTSSIPFNGTQSNGVSNGTLTSSPNGALLMTETISLSNVMKYITASFVNTTLLNSAKSSSQNTTLSLNTAILPSNVMINATTSLVPNETASDNSLVGSRIISPNGTSQDSTLDNSTKPIKAYKTEFFGEVIVAVFKNTIYNTSIPNDGNLLVNCSFIPGDGTPVDLVKTNASLVTFSHRYFSPGRYRARITCIQNSTVLMSVSRRVFVSMPVVNSNLSFPDRIQANKTYFCVINVNQASALEVQVVVGDGLERTHRFAATSLEIISAENETNQALKNMTMGFYSPLLIFETTFYVRCVELVSNISGTINLKVFRPVAELEDIQSEEIGNQTCVTNNSSSNATICFQRFTSAFRNSSSHLATTEFTAVYNIRLTVGSGYNFLSLPDDDVFKAQPGDVIAYTVDQAGSYGLNSSSPSRTATSAPDLPSHATSNASYNVIEKFSLYGFVPYTAKISLRFMTSGVFALGITIREFGGIVTDFRNIITIQQRVWGLQFIYKSIVRNETSRLLGFELTRGTNASCDWLLTGNGVVIEGSVNFTAQRNVSENTDAFEGLGTSFLYPHDIPGTFIFLVNCSNEVSTISENVTISVRRNVSDLVASLCFASFAYAHARTCWISSASGDVVGYKWIIENEDYDTSKFEMVFQNSTLPGNGTPVFVTAWNVVSKKKMTLRLNVLKNPLSIQILPALTVASKSPVNITALLDWSPYPNGSALYTDYGLNISDCLQDFIDFPTFKVKIDGLLITPNISNGTLRNYQFPMVGSKSQTYDVYFEATRHREMNREIVVRVVDRIESLRIVSECSNEVFVATKCVFTATFDGSDVICDWTVGSQNINNICRISCVFNELGYFKVSVNARNQISTHYAVYSITVFPEPPGPSAAQRPGSTSTSVKPLPIPSIASSVGMTYFAKESLTPQLLTSNIELSTALTSGLINTLADEISNYATSSTIIFPNVVYSKTSSQAPNQSNSPVLSTGVDQESFPIRISPSTVALSAGIESANVFSEEIVMNSSTNVVLSSVNLPVNSKQSSISSRTTKTRRSATIFDQSQMVLTLSSKINVSSSKIGPSTRSIESSQSTTATGRLLSSAMVSNQSETVSMLSSKITTASPTKSGPLSRSINFVPKPLKISGPRFAAVGKMVTFYALNVDSPAVLTWVMTNNTWLTTVNNSISYIFNHTGEFKVVVNASSLIGNQNASFIIVVHDPISGFHAFVYKKSQSKRVDILFSITSGTDVSYSVNFGDGSKSSLGEVREVAKNISVYHLYDKSGFYNLSISVFSKVGPNNTEYAKVFINGTCTLETAILYGVSEDLDIPNQFTDKHEIAMTVRTVYECIKVPKLKYTWKIVRLNSSIPSGLPVKLTSDNGAIFQFPAKLIGIGDYKVQVTMEDCLDGSSLTRVGYFRKVLESLSVRVSCGVTRVVPVDEPLTMNATVIAATDDVTVLWYEWFSEPVWRNTWKDIQRNMSVVQFPGNIFNVGEVYEFVVRVNDGKWKGVTSQEVTFGLTNLTLALCLSSSQDNKHSVFHTEDTEIIPFCPQCSSIPKLAWSWRVLKLIAHLNSTTGCAAESFVLNSTKLYIPANTLQPNTLYRVQVNVTSLTENITGRASYEFRTNDIPTTGYCDIQTSASNTLLVAFKTVCYAWYDRDQPLNYEYWYSNDGAKYSLFYSGEASVAGVTFFEAGLAVRDYVISVKVVIKDSMGAMTTMLLSVKNVPPSDEKIVELFNSSRLTDNQVESLLNESNVQGAIQFLKTISSIVNEKSNVTEGYNKIIEIRERILRNLRKLCCSDSAVIKQIAEATLSVSSVPSELNLDAQLHASAIFLNVTQRLYMLSTKNEVKNVAEKITSGISLLLSAVSLLSNSTKSRNITEINEINEASLLVIDKLGDILLHHTQPGEPAIILATSSFIIALQKHFTAQFPGTRLTVPNQVTEFMIPRNFKPIQGSFVSSKMVSMINNPFVSQTSISFQPTTNVASLELIDTEGNELQMNNLAEPFNILLDSPEFPTQDPTQSPAEDSTQFSTQYSSKLIEDSVPDLYEVNTTTSNPSILVTIPRVSVNNKGQLRLRISKADQSRASGKEYIVSTTSSFPVSFTWGGLQGREAYYVSIKYESLAFRLAGKPNEIEYSVSFREIDCYYWNVSREKWKSNGCKVGLQSTTTTAHCECDHLTWFGGRVVVPPNSISFANLSERITDPSNYATILAVLCCVLILYCLVLVWARRHDMKDDGKNKITWCPSNHVSDSHQYQVIIHTGIRRNAGTTANVGLVLSGEFGKSRKCLLKSSKREVFKRGQVDSFLVTTNGSLGLLDYIHIWHDNNGSDAAWFLNRVVVLDAETGHVANFLCYRWLAVDEGDGQIQRLLPIANAEDLRRFRHLFVSRATSELTDTHLWFSVAFRPACSPFTRVQRVSCCLALLLTSMMANAMWYETAGSGNGSQIHLGLFSFSWDELFIGVCSSLIVFPLNLLLVQVFRHCRSKNQQPSALRRPSLFPAQNAKVKPGFLNLHSSVLTTGSRHGSADRSRDVSPVITTPMLKSAVMTSSTMTSPVILSSRKTPERTRKASQLSCIVVSPQSSPDSCRSVTSLRTIKDSKLLPHWCQYIGWLGVLVTCLTSATVTFLYAVEFGEEKTRKWLLSLTISLVNDVFIAQPSKVLVVTVILAYILKRPLKERYTSDDVIQVEVLETVPAQQETAFEAPDFNLCTADEFLRAAREKREKDKFMYGLMKNVVSHLCFTVLVLIIAYGQRDVMGYHLTATQENTFVYQNFTEKFRNEKRFGFYQVANVNDFWLWNKAVLLPGLSNNEWYNYTTEWSTFTANFGGFLFGAARMRQKRLRKGVCDVLPMFKDIIQDCSGDYEWSNEDQANYNHTWMKKPGNRYTCNVRNSGTLPPDQWCYSHPKGLITAPYVGRLETYSGGGYNQVIRQNYQVALNLTEELKGHRWIDKYTRAVFVEFTLYNPNVNLFSIVTFVFEISASGDFKPGSNILSIRLYNYVGDFQIFVLVCQLLFLGSLCAFTYSSAKGIFRERWRFFSNSWNLYEVVFVVVSWLAVAIYFVAIVFRKRILQEFREDPTKFTSFRHSASWQMSLEYMIACLVFMVSLKFLRLFQFNRRMFLLSLTLSNTAFELLSYTVVFSIVLTAFSLLFYLMLQAYNPNFVNIIVTMETLLRVLLGKSDVLVKHHQFPVLERVVIFVYMCLMKFILLNIFIVILNDGFSRARAQNNTQRNAFEFVDFVKNTVNELLGIKRLNVAKKKTISAKRRVRFKDQSSLPNVEYTLRKLERKVETLLKLVNSDSFKEVFNDETLD